MKFKEVEILPYSSLTPAFDFSKTYQRKELSFMGGIMHLTKPLWVSNEWTKNQKQIYDENGQIVGYFLRHSNDNYKLVKTQLTSLGLVKV